MKVEFSETTLNGIRKTLTIGLFATAKNFDQLQISDDESIGHIIGPHINRVIH